MKKIELRAKKRFTKKYNKLSEKVRKVFLEKIEIFKRNQNEIVLNNHALTGEYKGYRSLNIKGDLRVIFRQTENGYIIFVCFYDIDNHNNLYK